MDRDEALREVQEIKQVIQESRRQSGRRNYWIGPVAALLAIIISGILPPLAPVIAIGLLVGGIIAWRRSSDTVSKAIAAGITAVGIFLLLAVIFVVVGLVAYHIPGVVSSAMQTVTPKP